MQNQRGALSLSPQAGRVLVPFGGLAGDCGAYHGYLVSALTTTGGSQRVFRTGSGTEAGMWQPSGAAVDAQGFAYPVSGNGSATAPPYDGSDSVNRVDPATGRSVSRFAPSVGRPRTPPTSTSAAPGWRSSATCSGCRARRARATCCTAPPSAGSAARAATVTGVCAQQYGGPAVRGDEVDRLVHRRPARSWCAGTPP